MIFQSGSLVKVRDRDWVVQPSSDPDLVLLKPLGGTDDEITGIYLPLNFREDEIKSTNFPNPTIEDLGDISSARLLLNATRLAFRSGAGPFRSLARLSFRPRSYQMVPLIMALRQEKPFKLFIADDVGVGKTIEALLVLKELLERREIRRFAIIVLPHLCEQWQNELKDKFGIDAVIIRSNTQARLDREIQGDQSVFKYYPYQIISIDYIKSDQRRQVFIKECPEFVIVDEAHTCAEPTGVLNSNQQQRYALIRDIASKKDQNIILLTATPHSGKPDQFRSLIGLLNPKFADLDLPSASLEQRKEFAQYYVQRRRGHVLKWMNEDTPFPVRDSGEVAYAVSQRYVEIFNDVIQFIKESTRISNARSHKMKMRYWSALALLRAIMSSPAAGIEVIGNRLKGQNEIEETENSNSNPIIDEDNDLEKDYPSANTVNKTDWTEKEISQLISFSSRLEEIKNSNQDLKAVTVLHTIEEWMEEGNYNTVVFCRFIATANYLGDYIKKYLSKKYDEVDVQVVTSEEPDEVRKSHIDDMGRAKRRILVATDCLSEGINLQDKFNAVLHYDLPWNPNRLEQREGRIDRFGQPSKNVKTYLFYGKNNPMDGVVLRVLLKKVQEIRRATGISIPFPEDSKSLMDAILQDVLLSHADAIQTSMDFGELETVSVKEREISHEIEKAAGREKAVRDIFDQHAIKAEEIEHDLKEADETIGDPKAVEEFVVEALTTLLGVQISPDKKGYVLFTTNLPDSLKSTFPSINKLKVSFHSPVPEGYTYLGRNHLFVENLCQNLMSSSMVHNHHYGPARAAVIRCKEVEIKTTLLLFRVRNVIQEKDGQNQLVAEEMLTWGYEGSTNENNFITHERALELLQNARPSLNMTEQEKAQWLIDELSEINKLREAFDKIEIERSKLLIEAHDRFRKVLGGVRYKIVEPVLPMDLMGIYILLPACIGGSK